MSEIGYQKKRKYLQPRKKAGRKKQNNEHLFIIQKKRQKHNRQKKKQLVNFVRRQDTKKKMQINILGKGTEKTIWGRKNRGTEKKKFMFFDTNIM